jgi:hypothetical protein
VLLALAAVATVFVFYIEIALPTRILADYDVWTYFYPLRSYAAMAIQAGRFPLWNPDTFLGAPFFANPQTGLLYPGTVLFYVLPVPYAYSLSVILHVVLCWGLTFAFLRRMFAVGTVAGFVGASAFAFGGFVSSQVTHINQLSATALMPGIALAAVLGVRNPDVRWALIGAALFAAQLFAGHAQESYMTLWVMGIVLIWELGTYRFGREAPNASPPLAARERRRRPGLLTLGAWIAGVGAIIAGGGFALAAVQLLPTAELSAASIRGGGMSFAEATSFSLPPNLLARTLLPGYWFNPFGEYIGYIGGVGLGFAMLGFLFGRRSAAWCGIAMVVVGLVLALGNMNPLAPALYTLIPGLNLFRVPARWLLVYSFGAASLAALGVDWTLAQRAQRPLQVKSWARELWVEIGSRWRVAVLGISVLVVLATALLPTPSVSGRILLLWMVTVVLAFGLAALAHWWRPSLVAPLILVAVLADLRLAAIDLPQRHVVPGEIADRSRPIPSQIRAIMGEPGVTNRLLSVARTEYELDDMAALDARHPDLSSTGRFWFTSAMKLDEVMSPNVPLTYRLSTADGYDGGVLPLRRFLDIASLLIPREEVRSDGVLRTRLIAVPDLRFLDLLGVRTVIAGASVDVELDGVRYDVATARFLAPDARLTLELPVLDLSGIAVLASVSDATDASAGEVELTRSDGTREIRPLRLGREVYGELSPGSSASDQPTAGLSRAPRKDTAVGLAVPRGTPVTNIEWRWAGPGTLNLRAVTALTTDGAQHQLMLREGLQRSDLGTIKVFQIGLPNQEIQLRAGEIRDDAAALDWIRSASADELRSQLILAPDTAGSRAPGETRELTDASETPGTFTQMPGPPERLVFRRSGERGAGYLMVPDAWLPGWTAEIDGQPAAVQRADVLFKAVWVPAEAREVVLRYAPISVRNGAIISALASLTWLGIMFRRRLGAWARAMWRRSHSSAHTGPATGRQGRE